MKLWEKDIEISAAVEKFTIGNDTYFDLQMAKFDVEGTLAHIKMLKKIGLLSASELEQLIHELENIKTTIENGSFRIEPGVEDIHSQVELMLTRKLGTVGKKIHSGRSRNDQVLVDLRLFFRSELSEIKQLTKDLFDVLLVQAEQYKQVLMPGYTHTQVAMVSSFGLWFGAYAEALTDDMLLLQSIYAVNNQNPLGSAAGYGSSFPLDRKETTRLLGFQDLAYNSVYAQNGRGKTELFISFGLASLAATLGKLASDVVLFSNENFRFFKLPDAYTTGSSIMPHKKNPDVFELIRGHCNLLSALPGQVSMLNSNLISGYHRDFQLLKEVLFPALEKTKQCLSLTAQSLKNLIINEKILEEEKYKYLFTVEKVNDLVKTGVPFREAYQEVAADIAAGKFTYSKEIKHTHEGSIGNLCLTEIEQKMKALV